MKTNLSDRLQLIAVKNIPCIVEGDNIALMIISSILNQGEKLLENDVVVIAQKIVSKAEGRIIDLNKIHVSDRAKELALEIHKDPRLVEIALNESREIIAKNEGVLVLEHKLGIILANAGVDQSNIGNNPDYDNVLLLPENPDRSSEKIRLELSNYFNVNLGVVINDSCGRPWRLGTCGIAIGLSGINSLSVRTGEADLYGRELKATEICVADEIASSASLLMGQADEGIPAVIVRGLSHFNSHASAKDILRPKSKDLFR